MESLAAPDRPAEPGSARPAERILSRIFRPQPITTTLVVIALLLLVVCPLASLVLGSVTDTHGLTLRHFASALSDPLYLVPLWNSVELGVLTGFFSALVGVPLAWAISRTNVPAKGFIQAVVNLSYISPPFLTAIAYVYLLSPRAGLINAFLRDVMGAPWLTVNVFSMAGLVLVTVIHTFPFVFLLASSALQSVDASYEEAAQILGAGKLRTALTVTGPLVAPAILSGILLAFVNAIALFGSQAIIGLPGRVVTLTTRIYSLFDYPPQYGVASALSLIFVAITMAALFAQRRFLARRSYVTLAGKGSRVQLLDIGPGRWLLLAFCVLVALVALVAPYGTLIAVSLSKSWGLAFWKHLTFANYRFVLTESGTRGAILNSLYLATAAASLVVVLGALIAWIDLRTRLRGRWILDYVALVPLGLPGMVMAVALIQFWLRLPLALYGTLTILLLAYVGRYVPLGTRAANTSLRQVDASLEESAGILGASWGRTMREITLPLIRPGLMAGWLLVFVPAIQELSASILLFSSKSVTIAVEIYNLYDTGYTEAVAALAMVNMMIIALAIWAVRKAGNVGMARFGGMS